MSAHFGNMRADTMSIFWFALPPKPTSRAYEYKHLVAGLQSAFLDHLRPLLTLTLDDGGKFRGRASDHGKTLVVEDFAHIRQREDAHGLAMQALKYRGRRFRWRQERMPHRRAETA